MTAQTKFVFLLSTTTLMLIISFQLLAYKLVQANEQVFGETQNLPSALTSSNKEPSDLPLPLALFHDSGSGFGYPPFVASSMSSSSSSSPISPSLIAAKCWNNYENDNDCRQINVITGNSNNKPSNLDGTDDRLIEPILSQDNGDNNEKSNRYQPNSRPPNEQQQEISEPKPPIGSTILPELSWPQVIRAAAAKQPNISPGNFSFSEQAQAATTRRPNVYVATQYTPLRDNSLATIGIIRGPPKEARRCRDDNDADCDEPEDSNSTEAEPEGEETDADNDTDSDGGDPPSSAAFNSQEFGSGDGDGHAVDGDNDGTDDAEDIAEGSSIPPDNSKSISTVASSSTPGASQQNAEIVVVVHSTLPPTFATTSTQKATTSREETTHTTTTTTTTTPMPDDTFRVKPVFPPSSSEKPADDSVGNNEPEFASESGKQAESSFSTTSEPIFLPVPLPPREPDLPLRFSGFRNIGGSSVSSSPPVQSATQQGEQVWTKKVVRPPTAIPAGRIQTNAAAAPASASQQDETAGSHRHPVGMSQPARSQQALFSKILYALIAVLALVVLAMVATGALIYMRHVQRSQELIRKAHMMASGAGMAPGAGMRPLQIDTAYQQGAGQQMVASMSQGSQLLSNMHQARMLNAFGNPKSAIQGAIKSPLGRDLGEEDELHILSHEEQLARGGGAGGEGSLGDNQSNLAGTGNSSWSTEGPATSSQTTSSESPSQQEQQAVTYRGANQHPQQLPGPRRLIDYPDAAQNSSSGSSSESRTASSPDTITRPTGYPAQIMQQPPPLQMHQPLQMQANYEGQIMSPRSMLYQKHPGAHPAISEGIKRFSHPSRSMEQIDELAARNPLSEHQVDFMSGLGNEGPLRVAPGQIPFRPTASEAAQRAYLAGLPPPGSQIQMGSQQQASRAALEAQFRQPISAARVAMNPLATLARRYPPGYGLNRNIHSTDSGSLIVASPSLARTSSSSSFGAQMMLANSLPTAIQNHPIPLNLAGVGPTQQQLQQPPADIMMQDDYSSSLSSTPLRQVDTLDQAWFV